MGPPAEEAHGVPPVWTPVARFWESRVPWRPHCTSAPGLASWLLWAAALAARSPGLGVTSPASVSSCRRALRGEHALGPLRPRGVQERGHLRQPAHRRLPLRVSSRRVREALLRGDHQDLPTPVLCHLPRPEAAFPLHRLPHVSAAPAPAELLSPERRGSLRVPTGPCPLVRPGCRTGWLIGGGGGTCTLGMGDPGANMKTFRAAAVEGRARQGSLTRAQVTRREASPCLSGPARSPTPGWL